MLCPPPPDGDEEVVLVGERDGLHDIAGGRAAGDERGSTVYHGIPDLAHLVVTCVVRTQYVTLEVRFERLDICIL